MRYTANGQAVTTFNVAVNRRAGGQEGERRDDTTWFRVVAWERLAETCAQYLQKGRAVLVEGRIVTRSWDGQDGQKHYAWELRADNVQFLGGRGESSGAAASPGLPVGADGEGDLEADDLPF
ncbi:MAG: single-stranded DNA-binding protein [Dehalococcoidia bacterium]|nr:single-stranded DNA-binding protein [Dehalococcoidia bacterium]